VFASVSFIFLSNFLRLKFIFQNRNEKGLTLQLSQQMVQARLFEVSLKMPSFGGLFWAKKEVLQLRILIHFAIFFRKSLSDTFSEILDYRTLELFCVKKRLVSRKNPILLLKINLQKS
jgi:hypothetical protein